MFERDDHVQRLPFISPRAQSRSVLLPLKMMRIKDARAKRHHHSAILRHRNLFAVSGFLWDVTATMGTWVMTENTHHHAIRRNHLLEAAHEEMVKFERKENEFRRKDRDERAAELRLPLNEINVH
jgi:hypothetical protein